MAKGCDTCKMFSICIKAMTECMEIGGERGINCDYYVEGNPNPTVEQEIAEDDE